MFASEMKPGAYISFSTIQGHHGSPFPLVPVLLPPSNLVTPNGQPRSQITDLLAGTFSVTVVLPAEFLTKSGWTVEELTDKLQQLENDSLRLAEGWVSCHLQEKGTIIC